MERDADVAVVVAARCRYLKISIEMRLTALLKGRLGEDGVAPQFVIPAKAGIQVSSQIHGELDPSFRWDDKRKSAASKRLESVLEDDVFHWLAFDGADVAVSTLRTGDTALIGGGAAGVVAGVD